MYFIFIYLLLYSTVLYICISVLLYWLVLYIFILSPKIWIWSCQLYFLKLFKFSALNFTAQLYSATLQGRIKISSLKVKVFIGNKTLQFFFAKKLLALTYVEHVFEQLHKVVNLCTCNCTVMYCKFMYL